MLSLPHTSPIVVECGVGLNDSLARKIMANCQPWSVSGLRLQPIGYHACNSDPGIRSPFKIEVLLPTPCPLPPPSVLLAAPSPGKIKRCGFKKLSMNNAVLSKSGPDAPLGMVTCLQSNSRRGNACLRVRYTRAQ